MSENANHHEYAEQGAGPEPADPRDAAARDVVAYYHQPDKGPLLRGAILPLAEQLTAEGLTVHIERHWLHGPHLRLRVQGPAAQVAEAAGRGVRSVREWIGEHPSHSDQSTEELLAEAVEAGRIELIAPPYGPVVADNSVRIERVDRTDLRALIGEDGATLRDDLLRMGLPAVGAGARFLGEHGDSPSARLQLAVVALTAHAAAHPGGLVGGHYSFVSHLEDFLVHDDPDGSLRAEFEKRRQGAGERVTDLVARISGGGATGWEREWGAWSSAAWELTESRLRAGADLEGFPYEYRVRAAATGDEGAMTRWNQDIRTLYSEFHVLLRRSDPQGAMWSRPQHLIYRACTNALYRLFTICGVRSLERYLAAHLVVESVPVLTGHHWRDAIDAVIKSVENAERVS